MSHLPMVQNRTDMIGAFTFDGIQSYDFNLVSRSITRPLLPAAKVKRVELPNASGAYDFDELEYELRHITMRIMYIGTDYYELRSRAREIAAWLSRPSWAKLILHDEPNMYYLAKVTSELDLSHFWESGAIDVEFDCQPFAYALEEITVPAEDFTNPGTRQINFRSPQGSKFVIEADVENEASFAMNNQTLTYKGESGHLTIDNVKMEAKIIEDAGTGRSWTVRRNVPESAWTHVVYGNGVFVAARRFLLSTVDQFDIMVSSDGINWTPVDTQSANNIPYISRVWSGLIYVNGLFVVAGVVIMTSPDGVNWTVRASVSAGPPLSINGLAWGNNIIVSVQRPFLGPTWVIQISEDAINWSGSSFGDIFDTSRTYDISGVVFGNGIFVMLAYSYSASTPIKTHTIISEDGINWSLHDANISGSYANIAFGNGLFVSVQGSYIYTSNDGINWTTELSEVADLGGNGCLEYVNDAFLYIGRQGKGVFSSDGHIWTSFECPKNAWHDVAYGKGRFVAVSSTGSGRVMTSGGLEGEERTENAFKNLSGDIDWFLHVRPGENKVAVSGAENAKITYLPMWV